MKVQNYAGVSNSVFISTWKKWPTVGISAWIHGNEKAGVEALKEFYKKIEDWTIQITRWNLFLLLEWNEQALRRNVREVKYNLNRCINNPGGYFKKDEDEIQRWKQIKKIIDYLKPSYWLDLHTVSAPEALPYLFSGVEGYTFAKDLWIQNIAINWANASNTQDKPNDTYQLSNKNQWVADYVNYIWWFGYTFEAGSHNSPNWKENSMQAIINFLKKLDMIDSWESKKIISDKENNKNKHVHMEYRHTFKDGFEYKDNKIPASFTFYKKWDLIGYDIINWERKWVRALFDGYIVLPKDPKICENWKEVFFFGKKMEDIKKKQ